MLFGTISAKTGVLRSKIPVFAQPARRLSAIQSDFRVLEAKKTAAICNGACSNYFSREAKKKGNSFSAPASTQKTKRKTRRPAIRRANGLVVIHIRVASYIPGSIPGWLAPLRSYSFLPSFLPPSLPVVVDRPPASSLRNKRPGLSTIMKPPPISSRQGGAEFAAKNKRRAPFERSHGTAPAGLGGSFN